jgi:large subunit ribosomal protein L18
MTTDRKQRHKRIRAKVSGTEKRPRLSVFRSEMHIYAQIIDDVSGKTLVASSDIKMKKGKDKKLDIAKKVGLDIADKAKEKNIENVVFDRGGHMFHGRVKALADGAREGGLKF